jgi:DnaK suppressor protein
MPANHSTNHAATATSTKASSSKRAPAPAPLKATVATGKAVNQAPAKVAVKGGVPKPSKVTAKAAPKASPKPVKVAAKASPKAAPRVAAKTAPKASPKPAKVAAKVVKAAPKPAAAASHQATVGKVSAKPVVTAAAKVPPQKAAAAPKAVETESQKLTLGAQQESAPANHNKAPANENHHQAVVEKPAAKPEKAEPKKDRAAEEASKKPVVRRSSLVDFPVPPPPVRPPFVPPPKPVVLASEGFAPSAANASHSPVFIQKQRQRLLDLRDDLVDALSGMTRDTIRNAPEGSEASGSGMHQGDAGSDAYDRDFALSVLAKEQDALYEIDQALRRIQKGSYGICEMSNRKIPQARLEAIPFARLTVECQSQWEKEYGNRRFRPSNEVGFSGGNLIEDEDSDTVLLDDEEE